MLTVIETLGKRKVEGKDVTFPRQKIVTGFTTLKEGDKLISGGNKPNEKGELEAGYPSLAELTSFYKGQVEYPKREGKTEDEDCLVKSVVAGWNQTESNNAFARSPAQAQAQFSSAAGKMAKMLNIPVAEVLKRFPEMAGLK